MFSGGGRIFRRIGRTKGTGVSEDPKESRETIEKTLEEKEGGYWVPSVKEFDSGGRRRERITPERESLRRYRVSNWDYRLLPSV